MTGSHIISKCQHSILLHVMAMSIRYVNDSIYRILSHHTLLPGCLPSVVSHAILFTRNNQPTTHSVDLEHKNLTYLCRRRVLSFCYLYMYQQQTPQRRLLSYLKGLRMSRLVMAWNSITRRLLYPLFPLPTGISETVCIVSKLMTPFTEVANNLL